MGYAGGPAKEGKRNGKEKPGQRPSLPVPAKPARNQSGPRSGPGPQARSPPTKQSRQQGLYQDAQVAQMRTEMRRALMEENKALAEQQFASKSFLTSQVYTNAIDASFYDNWGKSAR